MVSDSDDLYFALEDSVDHIEWKLKQDESAIAVASLWIRLRRVNNAPDCMLDFSQELTRGCQASVKIPILSSNNSILAAGWNLMLLGEPGMKF